MYTGSLGLVSNQEDWTATFEIFDETNTAISIVGAVVLLFVTEEDSPHCAIISHSTADSVIIIAADGLSFSWTVPASEMASKLSAGTYSVFVRIVLSGLTTQLLSASVSIIDGGPSS